MRATIDLGSQGVSYAAERGDVIVIIDALRASTTIACGLAAGAVRVIPALTVDEALELRRKPDHLVAGERGGIKVTGFDFGNSPTELLKHRDGLVGRSLILTTSNGTRCVRAGLNGRATAILAAGMPNATAVARMAARLATEAGCNITLVAAGLDDAPNDEDLFTARLLLQILAVHYGAECAAGEGELLDPEDSSRVFAHSEAGQRLGRLGYAPDVAFCAGLDTLDIVPIYRDGVGFVPANGDTSVSVGESGNG